MTQKAPVFDKIIEDYLLRIATLQNTAHIGEILGVAIQAGQYRIKKSKPQ